MPLVWNATSNEKVVTSLMNSNEGHIIEQNINFRIELEYNMIYLENMYNIISEIYFRDVILILKVHEMICLGAPHTDILDVAR